MATLKNMLGLCPQPLAIYAWNIHSSVMLLQVYEVDTYNHHYHWLVLYLFDVMLFALKRL